MAWLYVSYSLAKVGMRINFSRVRLNSLSTKTSFSNSPIMKVTAPLKNWPVAVSRLDWLEHDERYREQGERWIGRQ